MVKYGSRAMFIHAVCHRLTAVAQWPPPPAASRHWLCRFPVTGERHFCYGGAAFGLLRQNFRPPVTENPLAPCRNRAVGHGAKHPGTTTLPTRGRTVFPHTGSFPHILTILFSFLFYRLKLKIPMLGIYGCGKCA